MRSALGKSKQQTPSLENSLSYLDPEVLRYSIFFEKYLFSMFHMPGIKNEWHYY